MRILALDPSAGTTGWALYDGNNVSDAGFVKFKDTGTDGDRYLEAHRWLKNAIYLWKPHLILIESYFFSSRFATGSAVNSEVRGVMKMTIAEAGLSIQIADPSAWKKQLTGRVYPTKAEKKLYGKVKAKKMVTFLKLKELGVPFPTHLINPKTGKKIQLPFDVSDAIGILVAHLQKQSLPFQFSPAMFEAPIQ